MDANDLVEMQDGVNTLATLIGSIVDVSVGERTKLHKAGFSDDAADAGGIEVLKAGLEMVLHGVRQRVQMPDV